MMIIGALLLFRQKAEVSHETGPVFRGTGTELDIWRNSGFSMMCDETYLNIRSEKSW